MLQSFIFQHVKIIPAHACRYYPFSHRPKHQSQILHLHGSLSWLKASWIVRVELDASKFHLSACQNYSRPRLQILSILTSPQASITDITSSRLAFMAQSLLDRESRT